MFLLLPVMTYGWLITSLFIWWMIPTLSWLEALTCAACVTATDPVLASSVVGKGKFAKRIPKHLRDLLSAESGCNDGMAFPFIYLSLYLIKYKPHATEVFEHWFLLTVLYECVFGAIYGVAVGYAGRHAIRFAERKNLIDRESFLVFYFVLALWCAGTGSMLGLDDLLVGFCCGVAFSNDGWFSQQTEESHVSNVIDLLLNLAFFVYFGAIIPWSSFNRPDWGITPWRLIVISILVLLFRRIPIMMALKPVIPDIKTWREALFAGHFGPIGVGAIFVAILARAELETGDTTPLAEMPEPGSTNYLIIELIWPITTFLIMASILVHGSSIAVFTLGKRINTMRITMSFTTANEEPTWMARLPRLTPKASMSMRKPDADDSSGSFPEPQELPTNFLSRRREEDSENSPLPSRPSSIHAKRRKNWDAGYGPGGPISDTAITPRRSRSEAPPDSDEINEKSPMDNEKDPQDTSNDITRENTNAFQEGHDIIYENKDGEVVGHSKSPGAPGHARLPANLSHLLNPHEGSQIHEPSQPVHDEASALAAARADQSGRERKPAWAYRFDDNVIVEDADGEVLRRYKIPREGRPEGTPRRASVPWVEWAGKVIPKNLLPAAKSQAAESSSAANNEDDDDNSDAKTVYSVKTGDKKKDKGIHWRMHDERGRKLNKQQFLHQLQRMDPHARAALASPGPSMPATEEDLAQRIKKQTGAKDNRGLPEVPAQSTGETAVEKSRREAALGTNSPKTEQKREETPAEKKRREVAAASGETPAEKRRREAALGIGEREDDSDDEGQSGRLEQPSRRREPGIRFVESKGKGRGNE